MNPVKIISGIAAPFLRINVDTDAIIPSREIKTVSKKGLSEGLFSEWRYTSTTERKPNDNFVLNQDPYNRSLMLLTGDNFGCGSSREHDLETLKISYGSSEIIFDFDKKHQILLLEGLDEIQQTLKLKNEISSFEEKHLERNPWL